MKIKSNAASAEYTSPFYKTNEDFCRVFENYVASKNGKIKGNYNAWSYFIQAEIMAKKPWKLKYKKATYTSTGNLILSSKKQNLLTLAEWSTPMPSLLNSEFFIHKKESLGFIKRLFNNLNSFRNQKEYVVTGMENNPIFIENLYKKLEPLFKSGEIYSIILKNNILAISLRTEKHHFDTFKKLLDL
jgi:hypothetical protein